MHGLEIRTHADAAPSAFLALELENVLAENYREDLPPLRIFDYVPVQTTGINPKAADFSYWTLTQVGFAAVMRTPSSEIPRVDLYRQKFTSPIKSILTSFGWTVEEMENAEFAQVPLDRESAEAARRVVGEQESDICINGHAPTQLPGLLTNPNISRATVAAGAGGSTFALKTADEQLRDLSSIAGSVVINSKGTIEADTLIMPLEQFNLIADKPRSATSDTTVLKYFLANNPYIKKVGWVRELDQAGTGGTDVMIAFKASPDVLSYRMVLPFEQRPGQEETFSILVACRSKSGGCVVKRPLGIAIVEGI